MFCCFERDFSAGRKEEARALNVLRITGKAGWESSLVRTGEKSRTTFPVPICYYFKWQGTRLKQRLMVTFPLLQLTSEGLPYFYHLFFLFAGGSGPANCVREVQAHVSAKAGVRGVMGLA